MGSIRALFAVLACVTGFAPRARAESLLERYPHDRTVTLSDGRPMALPLHITDAEGVVLAGLADLDVLRAYLAPEGLTPVPMTPRQGLVALYHMNYLETDLGPYRELVLCVAATRENGPRRPILDTIDDYAGLLAVYVPLLRGLVGDRSQDVLFTWKLFVTAELPLRAGLDVWGFPKSLADIDVRVGPRGASFAVEESGVPVVRGAYTRLLPWSVPLDIDAYLATPRAGRPTVTRALSANRSRFGLFMPWDDFEVNLEHPWGAVLDDIGFTPVLWHTMRDIESVFLPPAPR